MKSLIVGYGEIGAALYNVLKKHYTVEKIDINETITGEIDVMHICFPYTNNFVTEVKRYKELYKPLYTVIHSTVPIGTTKKCKAYFSPVRGVHPHLEKSLKTFVKYLAPKDVFLDDYFYKAGIIVKPTKNPNTLEAMKLYCTTLYGLNIIAEKEMWDFCKKHKLDFDIVYTDCNITYNEGYRKLGLSKFSKYVLEHKNGKIGGHCVIPNCELLDTDIAKFIVKQNKKLH